MSARRLRQRARGRRGAVIVEAALVFPVLLLLTFAILEWGMTMKNQNSASAAAVDGARAFSIRPRLPDAETFARSVVERDVASISSATPVALYIYRAYPGPGSGVGEPCADADCTAAGTVDTVCGVAGAGVTPPDQWCFVYDWDPATDSFAFVRGGWPHLDRYACPPSSADGRGPDSVGVQVDIRHEFITGFFGAGIDMSQRGMLRLEPQPLRDCGIT